MVNYFCLLRKQSTHATSYCTIEVKPLESHELL